MAFGRSQGLFEALNTEPGSCCGRFQAGKGALELLSHFQRAIISGSHDIAGSLTVFGLE